MKRKLVLGLLAIGAVSVLCGFDSAETPESILEKVSENSDAQSDVSAKLGLNCDVSVDIGDGTTTSTLAILVTGDYTVDAVLDPLAVKVDGKMSLSTFGQADDVTIQVYIVPADDNSLQLYTYTQDSASGTERSWSGSKLTDFNLDELMNSSASFSYADMQDWGISYELAPEAAEFNGKECYLLSTTLDSSTLDTILQKSADMTGEDLTANADYSTALSMLDGLKVNVQYYVDTATYLPAGVHVDLNGSDLSALTSYLTTALASSDSASTTTIGLNLNDVSMDITMDYGTAPEITVPQEALDSVSTESESELSLDDYLNGLETEDLSGATSETTADGGSVVG